MNKDNDQLEVISSAFIILVIKVLAAAVGFAVSVVITRYLDVEQAGSYFFILSLLAMLSTIGRVGTDNAIVRFIAAAQTKKEHYKVRKIFTLSVRLVLFATLLIMILGEVFLFLGAPLIFSDQSAITQHRTLLMWSLCLVPFISLLTVIIQCFQGMKSIFPFAFFNAVLRPINLFYLMVTILFLGTLSLKIALLLYGLTVLLTLILAYIHWLKVQPSISDHPCENESITKEFYQNSYSLWGLACLAIVMGQGAQVLLGLFSSAEQVAHFAVANRVAMLLAFVLLAINGILSPKFAEIVAKEDYSRLENVYRSSTKLMIIVTCPVLIVLFIFAPEILLLFGEEYQQATLVLRILIAAQFIKVAVGSVGQLLIMSGFERNQRAYLVVSVLMLVILSLWLMPIYGALGAAVATFFAMVTNNILGLINVYRKLHIRLF